VSAQSHSNFDINCRACIRNSDFDGLSRYPYEKIDTADSEVVKFDNSTVKAICSVMQSAYWFALPGSSLDLVEVFNNKGQVIAKKDMTANRIMQRQDLTVDRRRRTVLDQDMPIAIFLKDDMTKRLQLKSQFMRRGILFMKF